MISWIKAIGVWLANKQKTEQEAECNAVMPEKFIIFLDFDGVLHPYTRGTFVNLDHFHRILDKYSDAKVVITSSWRSSLSLSELKAIFDAEYQHRIIGVTPQLAGDNREAEISAYLAAYPALHYIAIDDDAQLFPSNPTWLVKLDPKAGLDDKGLIQVLQKIQALNLDNK